VSALSVLALVIWVALLARAAFLVVRGQHRRPAHQLVTTR
jgi:hypothetical protein